MMPPSACDNRKFILDLSAYSDGMHFPICYTKDIFANHMTFNLRPVILILLMISILPSVMGQAPLPDTSGVRVVKSKSVDAVFRVSPRPSVYGIYTGGAIAMDNIFLSGDPAPNVPALIRKVDNRDWIFYFYCAILLFLSFIQLAFDRYFIDLFRVFFNTSLRQKQIREQLSQAPLPSLLLNILFFISGGAFVYFLLEHYSLHTDYPAPLEIIMAVGGIAIIYFVKYVFITLLGWVFDMKDASENYLFNVYMVNKIAGLVLIPLGILLAYSSEGWKNVVITLTAIFIVTLIIMRMIRCFNAVSNALKINPLHFIVFVGAFEVIPLLVLYRLFLRVIE